MSCGRSCAAPSESGLGNAMPLAPPLPVHGPETSKTLWGVWEPGRSADPSWSESRTHPSSAAEVAVFDVLELHNCLRCPRSVHPGGERSAREARRVTGSRPIDGHLPPHPVPLPAGERELAESVARLSVAVCSHGCSTAM